MKECPNWPANGQRPTKIDCFGEGSNKENFKDCEYDGDFGFQNLPDKFLDYITEEFLIYNTTSIMGRICMIDATDPTQINELWFKNMTLITQSVDHISDYMSDLKATYQHMLIIAGVAFFLSIISLIII